MLAFIATGLAQSCPDGYQAAAGLCVKLFQKKATRAVASDKCQQDGGRLVLAKTQEIIQSLYQLGVEPDEAEFGYAWVGAEGKCVEGKTDEVDEKSFTWSDGSALLPDDFMEVNEVGSYPIWLQYGPVSSWGTCVAVAFYGNDVWARGLENASCDME